MPNQHDNAHRTRVLSVRLSAEEWLHLAALARAQGASPSAYVRWLLDGARFSEQIRRQLEAETYTDAKVSAMSHEHEL